MIGFVLDNSISMRWLLTSEKAIDQAYAEDVLESMLGVSALVPNLWHLEAISVLLGAEKRKEINLAEIEGFISQLENLPIQVDPLTAQQCFSKTLALSREYNLSSYDASYLELALREGIPLASLDKKLLKAAKHAEIEIFSPSSKSGGNLTTNEF